MAGKTVLGNMVIQITAEADAFNKAVSDTQKKMTAAGKDIEKTGISMTDLNQALELGKKAYEAVSKAIDQTVGITVDYNREVREMMQLTGLSAEETSRVIQVADDWGISLGDVRSALELMNKKGITPSIENLAKIADEYVNAADKTAFMENATKLYGKSFGTLVPILAKGGNALREQAASIADNMLATNDSIEASRNYEVALDNLTDTVTGIKYELGEGLLPVLIDVTKALNDLIVVQKKDIDIRRVSADLEEQGIITHQERLDLLWRIFVGTTDQTEAEAELNAANWRLNGSEQALIDAHTSSVPVTMDLAQAQLYYNDAVETYSQRSPLYLQQYKNFTDAQRAAEDATLDGADAMWVLQQSMGRAVENEMEDYTTKQDEILNQMQAINDEIATKLSQGYSEQGTDIQELYGQYDELSAQYDANATAHELATARILYDLMAQKLAMTSLPVLEQAQILQDYADSMNLTGTSTAMTALATQQLTERFAEMPQTANNIENYNAAMDYMTQAMMDGEVTVDDINFAMGILNGTAATGATAIDRINAGLDTLDGRTVTASININATGGSGGGAGNVNVNIALASGGEFWADQPTLMLVGEGGERERVKVTPESQMGSSGGDTIIINDRLAYKMWKESRERETRKRLEALL